LVFNISLLFISISISIVLNIISMVGKVNEEIVINKE
jgi:hypothetical protein